MDKVMHNYKYGGARALVLLHERHLRALLLTWKEAKAANVTLPTTSDPSFASLNALLQHNLAAARGYMTWMCEKLNLADPEINEAPSVETIDEQADSYLEHVLERWRIPLADIEEERFYRPAYTSRWGSEYCIDGMLEHAVMHPVRHEFQLRNLLDDL